MGLAVLTVYIGAHKGLTSRSKQQLQLREVRVDWRLYCQADAKFAGF